MRNILKECEALRPEWEWRMRTRVVEGVPPKDTQLNGVRITEKSRRSGPRIQLVVAPVGAGVFNVNAGTVRAAFEAAADVVLLDISAREAINLYDPRLETLRAQWRALLG